MVPHGWSLMMFWKSFNIFIKSKFSGFVRLSVHPSSGATKLSVPLIDHAGGVFPRTPWHSCIAISIDGSLRTCHSQDVSGSHRLIERRGRPYYYREKSKLWDWDEDLVHVEPSYPRGLLVTPFKDADNGRLLLEERYVQKLQELDRLYGGCVHAIGFLNDCKPFSQA